MRRFIVLLTFFPVLAYAQDRRLTNPWLDAKQAAAEARRAGCQQMIDSGAIPKSPFPRGQLAILRGCMFSDTPLPP